MGDVILTEPVARALKRTHSGVRVDLLTDVRWATLMERAGYDRVIGYDPKGADRGWSGLDRLVARLGSYDVVIDLQAKLRTAALARRVDAATRLVLRKRTPARGLRAWVGAESPLTTHSIDLYLSALAPLGVQIDHAAAARLRSAPNAELGAGERGAHRGMNRIGLFVGAGHATKRWPVAHHASLARLCRDRIRTHRLVLLGGPQDRPQIEQLERGSPEGTFEPIDAWALDADGLADLISTFEAFVGGDSGPTHLAQALGVPTIALFGPTTALRWGPRSPEHRVVRLDLPCAPCSNFGGAQCPIPERDHECMRALDPERVFDALQEALGAVLA